MRTRHIGNLQESSLLELAISRSAKFAYILGNYKLFTECHQDLFAPLANHSRKLIIPDGKSFDNVEEICAHAYELSQALSN